VNPELEARLRRFGASVDAAADAAEARRAVDPLPPRQAGVSYLEPVDVPPRRQPRFYRVLAVAAAAAAVAIALGVVVARSPSPDGTGGLAGSDSSISAGVAAAATGTAPSTTTARSTTSSTTSTAPTTTTAPANVVCPSYRLNETLPLRLCDKGDAVRAVQQRLRETVAADLLVDGYLGPTTEEAVRTFQQLHGLEVDGLVGPDSWSALFAGVEQTPVSGATAG
jgi:Putative peptidoglycan binding domain